MDLIYKLPEIKVMIYCKLDVSKTIKSDLIRGILAQDVWFWFMSIVSRRNYMNTA